MRARAVRAAGDGAVDRRRPRQRARQAAHGSARGGCTEARMEGVVENHGSLPGYPRRLEWGRTALLWFSDGAASGQGPGAETEEAAAGTGEHTGDGWGQPAAACDDEAAAPSRNTTIQ